MILGCDFCNKHVETICPRARMVELDDFTTIPIVLKPSPRPQDAAQLPEGQEFIPRRQSLSLKVENLNRVVLLAESQTWV